MGDYPECLTNRILDLFSGKGIPDVLAEWTAVSAFLREQNTNNLNSESTYKPLRRKNR